MKAVFLDGYSLDRSDLDFSNIHAQLECLEIHPQTLPDEIVERIAGHDIVLVNKVSLDRRHLENTGVRLICVAATGTNNIDLEACSDLGITVTNCQGYGTDSVAQHVIGLMLNLSNRMIDYSHAAASGDWHRSTQFCLLDYPIQELAGKTLGIVGYGTLGKRVAELGRAFGMNVAISARPGDAPSDGRKAFEDVLACADFLSLHCPLTEATHHLIGENELTRMKPGAYLINTARGGLIDEAALTRALDAGSIAGAGLDVVDGEPPTQDCPLLQHRRPNLIVTPHSGWGAREARQRIVEQIAENIEGWTSEVPVRVVT